MKTRGFAIMCCIAVSISGVAVAGGDENQLRFGLVYSMPTDDLVVGTQVTELDDALGFQVAFEFRITDRIGIEPGISSTSFDVMVTEPLFPDVNGETQLLALTTNVNFHFKRNNGVDLFVGPTVGYAFWDDLTLDGFLLPIATDDEVLFGAHFGLDAPFGEGAWAFHAGVSYLFFDITPAGGAIGVSPLQTELGLTYSF